MTTVAWKQLLVNALESNSHLKHSAFFQLATVGTNGTPSNRTVVFRGFQDNTDNIQINTDGRTRKIEELKLCSSAEICWYFTDSWEQFRIHGVVDVIDGSNPDPLKLQQREKSWFASSLRSRSQYLGPHPGIPCISEQGQPEISLDPSTGPVDAFCLLILEPDQQRKAGLLRWSTRNHFHYLHVLSIGERTDWSMPVRFFIVQCSLDQPSRSLTF